MASARRRSEDGRLGTVPISTLPHDAFKARKNARALVRSGEFSACADVILRAGVAF